MSTHLSLFRQPLRFVPGPRSRDRRTDRLRYGSHRPSGSLLPTVEEIVEVGRLLRVAEELAQTGGQAPGSDGIRYDDLARDQLARILRDVTECVLDGSYRPGPTRRVPIPKSKGGRRYLSLPNVIDRIVGRSLHDAMTPYWESVFSSRSHGFRPNKSAGTLLEMLRKEARDRGRRIIVIDDIRRAFDEVDTIAVVEAHWEHIPDDNLIHLIESIVRGHTRRTRGIDQGAAYSPTAMNVVLEATHDRRITTASRLLYRYADNVAYLVRSPTEGYEAHAKASELLSRVGLRLKGTSHENAFDLRTGATATMLGLDIRLRRAELEFRTADQAWTDLETAITESTLREDPPETASAVVQGWIQSQRLALETWTDTDAERIARICAQHGIDAYIETICAWIKASRPRPRTIRAQ